MGLVRGARGGKHWAQIVQLGPLDEWVQHELPPIDVLMVWHAYTLNPSWYAEDCLRLPIAATLRALNDNLLTAIVAVGDIGSYKASETRKISWAEMAGTPFDPLDAAAQTAYHDVDCPQCFVRISVPYITSDGTGYAQHKFAFTCPACGFAISKESLAVLKFARNVAVNPYDPAEGKKSPYGIYLAGTLRTLTNPKDEATALITTRIIHRKADFTRPPAATKEQWVKAIVKQTERSMLKVLATLNATMKSNQRRVRRMLSAYTDDRPFSIDLVGAVIRQCSFVDKMHLFGWTEPGYFDDKEDEAVLIHAITRYHAFLDLMSSSVTSFFVPTLDIDLAWHTHQMMAETYQNNCAQYCKRYIDHDDKVEENHLATSFDITCRAWEVHTILNRL
ncbi:hypothetical protein EW026_g3040 [Hermanssonia centrifuga]|uniref:Uncharacterized protein n=1 Tax=Hermanssonia centrifuga TaxID=98765 RepID=A0A4S4KLE7_9APHY|nr:hypothetical protein EW026_g3040 [Hermanssonia centrifuga]